ncbi:hypothetical protein Tco_1377077, partial [Tanacetum coccineum]
MELQGQRNIMSYLLQKHFKLLVISRQLISFSKDYHLKSMHWLASIMTPRNFVERIQISHAWNFIDENKKRVFKKDDDPIDAINHMMSFFDSCRHFPLPHYNKPAEKLVKPRQQAAINNGRSDNCVSSSEPNLSDIPTNVEVPKELPKVSMVNTSLTKLKYHLALKDLFSIFNQQLVDELAKVQNVFYKMEQAVEQYRADSKTFKVKMNQALNKNERLLEQVMSKDIVNLIVNSSMDFASVNVHECEKCLKLETELQKDFVEKEIYDKLFKRFTTLEKHYISLEVDTQLNQEIFQRDNSISNQCTPSFDQLFELNELKAQSQEKDMVIKKLKERIKSLSGNMDKDKIKQDLEEIETINIELDHRSVEISDLNACLREIFLVITTLKEELRKLKGKDLANNEVTHYPSDPEINTEPTTPKLLNKRSVHSAYIKHTQEEAAVLRDLVEQVKSKYPLDHSLESSCRYVKLNQELLTNISQTCPSINNTDGKLVAVIPKNKDKRVRFTEPVTSLGKTITKTVSTSNLVSNKPMLSFTGVKPSTSACGSQPSGNTKKDKIRQTPSSTQKNKVPP